MLLLYCADPLARRQVDGDYAAEALAASAHQIDWALIDFEALVAEGSPERAVRAVPEQPEETLGIYRGWMLRPSQYAHVYAALLGRGVHLINDPEAYARTHLLPGWYDQLAEHTPRTVWLPISSPMASGDALDIAAMAAALRSFGDQPVIVKDYVKSRKHEWAEACFIPSASNREAAERVVRRFVELQGADLEGGLAFREYVPFASVGVHSRTGMPLSNEYRVFWLDGAPLAVAPYWDEGDYAMESLPPVADFAALAARVESRFFTMDLAQRAQDGVWQIVELGDGQVAGLPERLDVAAFYAALARRMA